MMYQCLVCYGLPLGGGLPPPTIAHLTWLPVILGSLLHQSPFEAHYNADTAL